jgi:predicted amidophosphoribosyltransferase
VVPWLADAIVQELVEACASGLPAVDAVTWAPTSRERRRRRGFDPAELLARAVARRMGARTIGTLERGPGPPQTGLVGADRRRGPQYRARRRAPESVLLVDDVATTGATLAAAATALRDAGTRIVVAATAARTPPPSRPRSRPSSRP